MSEVNAEIRNLRDSIIAIFNASPLPIEIKRLIVSELNTTISNLADQTISSERKAMEAKKDLDTEEG